MAGRAEQRVVEGRAGAAAVRTAVTALPSEVARPCPALLAKEAQRVLRVGVLETGGGEQVAARALVTVVVAVV